MAPTDVTLDPRVQQSLRTVHESCLNRGDLLTIERLAECYALFRERFGPERLRSLDGEALQRRTQLEKLKPVWPPS